jgi:hypothetical protein
MVKRKPSPKPLRLWVLVNRMGRTPFMIWSVIAYRRKDIEFHYLYWMCGHASPNLKEHRETFRENLKAGRYSIQRVTLTPEVAS